MLEYEISLDFSIYILLVVSSTVRESVLNIIFSRRAIFKATSGPFTIFYRHARLLAIGFLIPVPNGCKVGRNHLGYPNEKLGDFPHFERFTGKSCVMDLP